MSDTSPPASPRERSRTSWRSRAGRNQPPTRPRPGRGRSPARRALRAAGTAALTVAVAAGLTAAPAWAASARPAATVTSPDATVPLPVPIATRVNTGTLYQDGYSFKVQIGDQAFPAPALTGSCGIGMWMLTVTRTPAADKATGKPGWDPQNSVFPMCTANDAKALGAAISKLGDDRLVIINDIESAGNLQLVRLPQLAAALAPIGVTNEVGAVAIPVMALSIAGIHGLSYGQAWQRAEILNEFASPSSRPGAAASIDASLVPDINGRYVLTSYGYVVYNDDATAGGQPGIAVGGHFYPQPPLPPSQLSHSGFQVLLVNRQTLAEISNTSYCLEGLNCNGLQSMTAALDQVGGNEGVMAFIRSYGPDPAPAALFGSDPASAALVPQVAAFAGAIRAVGGTPQALFGLAATTSPAFQLAGAASPPAATLLPPYVAPEAASTIPGQGSPPDLTGVLAPGNRGMWYSPLSDATVGGINLEIYSQLATITQPPTPWPVPAPGNTAQADALQSISDQICDPIKCGGNVRSAYTTGALSTTFSTYLSNLDSNVIGSTNCGAAGLNAYYTVACQLRTELADEATTHELRTDLDNLLTAYTALSSSRLTTIYNKVNAEVHISGSTKVGSILREVISGLLEIAGGVVPEAHAFTSMTSGVLNAANSLADLTSGEPEDALTTTADNLVTQTGDGFVQMTSTLKNIFGYIDTDWGRLNAVTQAYHTFDQGDLLIPLDRQIQVSFYQSLLAALYQVATVAHSPVPCTRDQRQQGHDCYYMDAYSDSSVLSFRTATDKPGTPEWQVTGIGEPFGVRPLSGTEGIPASLMQALANPGLGIYPPDIFLGWPFPQFHCAFNPDVQGYSCTRG